MRLNASSLVLLLSPTSSLLANVAFANELSQHERGVDDPIPEETTSDALPLRYLRGLKNKNKNYSNYNNGSGFYSNSYNSNSYSDSTNNNGNNNNSNSGYSNNGYNSGANNYSKNSYSSNNSYGSTDDYNNNGYSSSSSYASSGSKYGSGSFDWEPLAKYGLAGLALLGLGYVGIKSRRDGNRDQSVFDYFDMGASTGNSKRSKRNAKSMRSGQHVLSHAESTFSDGGDTYLTEDGSKALGSVIEDYQTKINKLQKKKKKRSSSKSRNSSNSRSLSAALNRAKHGQLTPEELSILSNEKFLLRQMLGAYEKEFMRIYNRPIQSAKDTMPAAAQYKRYKQIKKITAPFESQQGIQLRQGNLNDFGFSSSRWESSSQAGPWA